MNATPLWAFIQARHQIYLRRAAGHPAPWTNNPILQKYRFCNVFRELDRVTIWVRTHMREPYATHPRMWFLMAIARMVNWPDTLQEVLDDGEVPETWNPMIFARILRDRGAAGEKVYTGAYMLRGPSEGGDKPAYTAQTLDAVWQTQSGFDHHWRGGRQPTLQEIHAWFCQFDGIGPFLAYEIVTDLRHTHYLSGAPDIETWANAGPGAVRGLNRLHERPLLQSLRQAQAVTEMEQLLCNAPMHVPWRLEMRDIEHCLCETDKYLRVQNNEGTPRARYTPTTE